MTAGVGAVILVKERQGEFQRFKAYPVPLSQQVPAELCVISESAFSPESLHFSPLVVVAGGGGQGAGGQGAPWGGGGAALGTSAEQLRLSPNLSVGAQACRLCVTRRMYRIPLRGEGGGVSGV